MSKDIPFVLFLGGLLIALGLVIWKVEGSKEEFKSNCESRGGVSIQGRDVEMCVDPRILR